MAAVAPNYTIRPTGQNYKGKSYNDLMADWTNWLVSEYGYSNNTGDPVFLASVVPCTQPGYTNRTLVMAGNDRIYLTPGRSVFFMAIGSIFESKDNACPDDAAARSARVNTDLDAGAIPTPADILIDGLPIQDAGGRALGAAEMNQHRIVSSDFMLNVPSKPGLGPCLDVPLLTDGTRGCCTGGFCFLITFTTPGTHSVRIHCQGAPWEGGVYFTDSFHEIYLEAPPAAPPRLVQPPMLGYLRPRSNQAIRNELDQKERSGELTAAECIFLKTNL